MVDTALHASNLVILENVTLPLSPCLDSAVQHVGTLQAMGELALGGHNHFHVWRLKPFIYK